MVIFNEKKYVQEIIEQHDKDRKINIKKLIKYIVKYFYEDYKDAPLQDYVRKVLDTINTFEYSDVYYREYMHYKYIKSLCKKAQKQEFNTSFRKIDSVDITEAEMEIIAKGKNERECKLLFTLYVLAKVYGYHSGWVNYPPSEIFKLANISLNFEDRFMLIHELYKAKLIELNHIIGKDGYKVELKEDSPTALTIKINHDFGNQYLAYVRDGWKICEGEDCMKLIRVHAPNQRYCKICAEKINRDQTKLRMQQKRG